MAQGRGAGMMGLRGAGAMGLVARQDVQRDLKMTDQQVKAVQAVMDDVRARMEAMRDSGEDRESMMLAVRDAAQQAEAKIKEILDDAQERRLREIGIQLAGLQAVFQPDVQRELGLTADQIGKINVVREEEQAAMQEMMELVRNQSLSRDEMAQRRRELRQESGKKLEAILTPANREALKRLGGAEFKADPVQGRRGGF
jgi:hypothetical protein